MNKKQLYLWFGYPDDLVDDDARAACKLILSEEERTRMNALRSESHRREYVTSHSLLRFSLSQHQSPAPEVWRFQVNPFGKPSPDPRCGLRFNMSNSPGLVACLIGNEIEVGVDLEPHDRASEIAQLAETVFSPLERSQLDELHGTERTDRALSLWTLKESYIKARGMGLSLLLKKFSFVFGGEQGVRLELDSCLDDAAERWRFCLLDHATHRIALAVERADAFDLQIFETRPPLAAPLRIPRDADVWYPLQPAS